MDIETIHKHYKQSTSALSTATSTEFDGWLDESQEWYKFVSGDQWSQSDLAAMREEERPVITYNRTGVMLDVVAGLEIQNRMEPSFFPRELKDDPQASEYMNGILEWVRDDGDFEEEESQAFADLLACGMGWTLTTINFSTDEDGAIEKVCIDPLRCRWDASNSRKNLKGSRWRMYVMDMNIGDVKRRWPKAKLNDIAGPWDSDIDQLYGGRRHLADQAWKYAQSYSGTEPDDTRVRVCLYQYETYRKIYRVDFQGQMFRLNANEFKQRKELIDAQGGRYVPQDIKEIRQAHVIGGTILDDAVTPTGDFTLEAMTGKYDKANKCFYGIIRAMKDPQLWANKFLSSILDIVSANAKGGIMAEIGAFQNERAARDEWSKSNKIAMLEDGGIGKVAPKPVTGIPPGIQYLLEYTGTMFPHASGISLELMGLVERDQPGILEHQRKQSGLSILAWAFSALRYYRKTNSRTVMEFVRRFMSDGRMFRIQGDAGPELAQIIKDRMVEKYDVIVDESPTSVSMVERNWSVLKEIIPMALQSGIPIPPTTIRYIPLPEKFKTEWLTYIQEQSQAPEPNPAQIAEMEKTQSETEKNVSQAQLNVAKAKEISEELPTKIVKNISEARHKAAQAGKETGGMLMGE
jgi:hypothetical protein